MGGKNKKGKNNNKMSRKKEVGKPTSSCQESNDERRRSLPQNAERDSLKGSPEHRPQVSQMQEIKQKHPFSRPNAFENPSSKKDDAEKEKEIKQAMPAYRQHTEHPSIREENVQNMDVDNNEKPKEDKDFRHKSPSHRYAVENSVKEREQEREFKGEMSLHRQAVENASIKREDEELGLPMTSPKRGKFVKGQELADNRSEIRNVKEYTTPENPRQEFAVKSNVASKPAKPVVESPKQLIVPKIMGPVLVEPEGSLQSGVSQTIEPHVGALLNDGDSGIDSGRGSPEDGTSQYSVSPPPDTNEVKFEKKRDSAVNSEAKLKVLDPKKDKILAGKTKLSKGKIPSNKYIKHPLEYQWSFWINDPSKEWQHALRNVHTFGTAEDFWSLFNHIVPPSKQNGFNYNIFKEGIKPEWEDRANDNGGRWNLLTGQDFESADKIWRELCILFIGGSCFGELTQHLNGIYLCRKKDGIHFSLWLNTRERMPVMMIGKIIRENLIKNLHESLFDNLHRSPHSKTQRLSMEFTLIKPSKGHDKTSKRAIFKLPDFS